MILYPDIGYYLESTLFFTMFIVTLLSQQISKCLINIKYTIIFGCSCILIWLLSFNFSNHYIVFITTIICGIGNALFRAQQYIWIKNLIQDDDILLNMSISISIFNTYGIISSIIGFIFIFINFPLHVILNVFSFLVFVCLFLMIFIKHTNTQDNNNNFYYEFASSVWLLYPFTLLQSLDTAIIYTILPSLLSENSINIQVIAIFSLVYSFCLPCISFLTGKLFKLMPLIILLLVSLIISIIIVILMYLIFYYNIVHINYYSVIILGLVFSLHEGIVPPINFTLLGLHFSNNIFYVQRIFHCVSTSLIILLMAYIPYYYFAISLVIVNILVIIFYTMFYKIKIKKKIEYDII